MKPTGSRSGSTRRVVLTVLAILVVTASLVLAALAWQSLSGEQAPARDPWLAAPPLPTARSEMPAAALDGRIYVPGGIGALARTLTVFEAFDAESRVWIPLAPLPVPLHHSAAAAAGGRIFVSGGYTDITFREDNEAMFAYDPERDEWSRAADMPAPRAGHAMVEVGGSLYVVGGVGPNSRGVWVYHPLEDRWETLAAELPTAREHLAAVAVDGRIFVIAGRWEDVNLGTVEIFDPANGEWSAAPDLPTPRSGLTAAVVDGEIHVAGGEDLQSGGTFAAHEILDSATLEWREGPPLTVGRHGLASATLDSDWHVIGGGLGAGARTILTLTDAVHVLSVPD